MPQPPTPSRLKRYVVPGGLAAGCLVMIAAVFAFSSEGTYVVETSVGRAIVVHPQHVAIAETPIQPAPAPVQAPAGSQDNSQQERGSAIYIPPNAVDAEVTDVRTVGFARALTVGGTGSRITRFEAYRHGSDLPSR